MSTNRRTTQAIHLCEMCSANYSSVYIQIQGAKVIYCPQGGAEAIEQQSYLQSCIVYCSKGITHYIRAYQGELKWFGVFFQAI